MEMIDRLQNLSSQMQYEPADEHDCPSPVMKKRVADSLNVSYAVMPNGKQISLLKTLLTSACERDCYYCPFRAGRDFRRATLKPDEMAQAFMSMRRAGLVEGMFLSSGIAGGGRRIQDLLIDTAEILRQKHNFRGYIHLKIMPGAEFDQVERTMQLANRVSINLEAPNPARLEKLAPHKSFFEELVTPLRWVDEIRSRVTPKKAFNNRWPSLTTQFVIGAAGESDLEILHTTENLNRQVHLSRAYYSAFNPVIDTPLENQPATDPLRQHRLYQASFLMRDYGFDLEELSFENSGNLPLNIDPKLAWAKSHLLNHPIEINQAGKEDLLRLPGIGPVGVQAILTARKKGTLHDLGELKKLGIRSRQLNEFILFNGKKADGQLSLWALDSF
jgi:predicted DNA-binding helix-hairpin-helix protein